MTLRQAQRPKTVTEQNSACPELVEGQTTKAHDEGLHVHTSMFKRSILHGQYK